MIKKRALVAIDNLSGDLYFEFCKRIQWYLSAKSSDIGAKRCPGPKQHRSLL